jgi:hypothetical protein
VHYWFSTVAPRRTSPRCPPAGGLQTASGAVHAHAQMLMEPPPNHAHKGIRSTPRYLRTLSERSTSVAANQVPRNEVPVIPCTCSKTPCRQLRLPPRSDAPEGQGHTNSRGGSLLIRRGLHWAAIPPETVLRAPGVSSAQRMQNPHTFGARAGVVGRGNIMVQRDSAAPSHNLRSVCLYGRRQFFPPPPGPPQARNSGTLPRTGKSP